MAIIFICGLAVALLVGGAIGRLVTAEFREQRAAQRRAAEAEAADRRERYGPAPRPGQPHRSPDDEALVG
jgi:hypothetical protein